MRTLRFNDALRLAAIAVTDPQLPARPLVGVIRDLYGRLRFAVDAQPPLSLAEEEDSEDLNGAGLAGRYPDAAHQLLVHAASRLGAYASSPPVLYRDDLSHPDALFQHPDWHETLVDEQVDADDVTHPARTIRLLDRQVIGQDWLNTARTDRPPGAPPRVVFYGLKGGVGRSTALAMLAYGLARQGKNVLLLDFDLESPGLSGLLLPPDRVAGYGLVDWFIEDALDRSGDDRQRAQAELLNDLVTDSPLGDAAGQGRIRIATAMGQAEPDYLAKLSRVYADVPTRNGPERFARRMVRLVETLEQQEQPDVVLIDSRAGLHDLAAISIATLADLTLLFATDSEQNWQGYSQLFRHWQQRPEVCLQVRERLKLVRALFPETDQRTRSERFQMHAYDLFAQHLYDTIEPKPASCGAEDPNGEADLFSFAVNDDDAPHSPLTIRWNARFMEFDPIGQHGRGEMDDTDMDLAFGPFIRDVQSLIDEN
jgi:cellulose biosynthesis protein BcsQ